MKPETFKEMRNDMNLTQDQMADALFLKSGRTIRRWESGQQKIPGPAMLATRLMYELCEVVIGVNGHVNVVNVHEIASLYLSKNSSSED